MRAAHFVLGGLVVAALLIGFYIGFVLWEPDPSIKPSVATVTVEKTIPGEATERTVERTATKPCEGTLPDTGGHR